MHAIILAAALSTAVTGGSPALEPLKPVENDVRRFKLGEGVENKSYLRSVRGRQDLEFLRDASGDQYAGAVLGQNTTAVFFLDDVPDAFTFGMNPENSGANLITGDNTFKIDVETDLGGGMKAIEVHFLTENLTDWLPAGVDPGDGDVITELRIDVGAFAAGEFAELGADAPIQWNNGSFDVVSVEVVAYSNGMLLASGPIGPENQDNSNGLGAAAVFTDAAGAAVDEIALVWILNENTGGGGGPDCNNNGVPDATEIAGNPSLDCDGDGQLDTCEIAANAGLDCNANGLLDSCELASNASLDCDNNGQLDSCQIASNPALDMNSNGVLDSCENPGGGVDCNSNGVDDDLEIKANPSLDCDNNGTLDSCQIAMTPALDLNMNGVIDGCELPDDCNLNGLPDIVEIAIDPTKDCDLDGQLDACQIAATPALDLNGNGVIDGCELTSSCLGDITGNGVINSADLSELIGAWGPCP